jgi:hypothetical protein
MIGETGEDMKNMNVRKTYQENEKKRTEKQGEKINYTARESQEKGERRREKRGEEIIDEEKKGKLWTFKENVSGRGHGGGGARGGEGG